MADQQYDMSPKMREIFERKQKQRAAAKEFWRKHIYNPYLQSRPFDPVLFRYTALSSYSALYYRSNTKRRMMGVLFYSPILLLTYYLYKSAEKKEKRWRSGTVPYEDRTEKLLL